MNLWKKVKINIPVRFKNVLFWISILGVILATMGICPEMLTSWGTVKTAIVDLFSNPYQLVCVAIAIIGVFNDPTTAGITDSSNALEYTKPKKDDN